MPQCSSLPQPRQIQSATIEPPPLCAGPLDPAAISAPAHNYRLLANEYGLYSVPQAFGRREVARVLQQGAVYEPRTLSFLRRMARDGDVITGGAFIGDFLPALSQCLTPGTWIHSFEANPMAFASARHTVGVNGLRNVCLSNVAVGAKTGTLPLQVTHPSGAPLEGSARLVDTSMSGQTIDVPVVRLDDLVPPDRMVRVLHLDVEGFEIPALTGAEKLIRRCRPVLVVEAGKPRLQIIFRRFMRERFGDLAYRPAGGFEHNLILAPCGA